MEDPEHLRPSHPDQLVILVVDDEVIVRNVARITLEADGYFVLDAHDGEEALHISRRFPGTIHAVLSDVVMPEIDGLQLRERILTERPGIKVLLMSGRMDSLPTCLPFLAKPYSPAVLKDRIRQLLASAASI
jgi:two-component system cell cycle sensor histidine kinase/response regulator CckA